MTFSLYVWESGWEGKALVIFNLGYFHTRLTTSTLKFSFALAGFWPHYAIILTGKTAVLRLFSKGITVLVACRLRSEIQLLSLHGNWSLTIIQSGIYAIILTGKTAVLRLFSKGITVLVACRLRSEIQLLSLHGNWSLKIIQSGIYVFARNSVSCTHIEMTFLGKIVNFLFSFNWLIECSSHLFISIKDQWDLSFLSVTSVVIKIFAIWKKSFGPVKALYKLILTVCYLLKR